MMLPRVSLTLAAIAGALFCAQAQAVNILANPGFETGALAPWFAQAGTPAVSSTDVHSGNFSCAAFGGDEIRQNFAPVLTSQPWPPRVRNESRSSGGSSVPPC